MNGRLGPQRGAVAVEFAILLPALLLMLGLVVAAGRLAHARVTVAQIADSAARAASLARDPASARTDASAVVRSDAAAFALPCSGGPALTLDVAGFGVPVGQPAAVSASVSCQVDLAELVVPGLPGSVLVTGEASSSLDRYRGRR